MIENDNLYDNSRPLDVHVWSDHPFLLRITKTVWKELYPDHEYNRGKRESERFKHLRVVLIDLYKSFTEDSTQYIGYSRSHNSFNKTSRYNDLHISYAPLMHVVDSIIENGFVEHKKGVHALHKNSRLRATGKLIDMFNMHSDYHSLGVHRIAEEVIILKGKKDKDTKIAPLVEYKDDGAIEVYRANVKTYNSLLESTNITLDESSCEHKINASTDFTSKRVVRIFNDNSWNLGGRFFGGWWQKIKSENRRHIKINGQKTVEVDYKAFHIYLLYSIVGLNFFEYSNDDAYSVDGYDTDDVHRSFFKTVLLTVLNSRNEAEAIKGIRWKTIKTTKKGKPSKDRLKLPPDIDYETGIKKAIDSFMIKHNRVSRFFYTNIGKCLQFFESEIAETIIVHFTSKQIPILCIHDSFVCNAVYKDELKNKLIDTFSEFNLGLEVNAQVKIIQ